MQYRTLGRSGLKVSNLCLGTITYGGGTDEATAYQILDAFVEAGGNFLDTADAYVGGKSEQVIGNWMRERGNRGSIVLATKVGMKVGQQPNDAGLSAKHIRDAIEASLRRLQTGYIDLYQTHYCDYGTPFAETLSVLADLQQEGKVRYIGASNHRASELVEALRAADALGRGHYVSLQPHYNLINRDEFERELQWVCQRNGLGVLPFFPLASGFLTGKYSREGTVESGRSAMVQRRYFNDRSWTILDAVRGVATEAGASPAAVAIAWTGAQPSVTAPILGARTLDQVKDNLTAADLVLATEQIDRLNEASAWAENVTRPPGAPGR